MFAESEAIGKERGQQCGTGLGYENQNREIIYIEIIYMDYKMRLRENDFYICPCDLLDIYSTPNNIFVCH